MLNFSDKELYKVIYAPTKKKSILKKIPRLYYVASSVDEMKDQLRKEMVSIGVEYKEKYIQSYSVLDLNSDDIKNADIYKAVRCRIEELDEDKKAKYKNFYSHIGDDKYENDEFIEEGRAIIKELPSVIFSDVLGESVISKLEDPLKRNRTSPIKNVEDTNLKDSILGDSYNLEVVAKGSQIESIKPKIPLVFNAENFKTYKVDLVQVDTSKVILDKCEVVSESVERVCKYCAFVCKKSNLLYAGDNIVITIFDSDGNKLNDYFFSF